MYVIPQIISCILTSFFALLILLIFYWKNSQKSNISLDNKNLKWGKYHYEINVFLKYTLTIIGTPRNSYE